MGRVCSLRGSETPLASPPGSTAVCVSQGTVEDSDGPNRTHGVPVGKAAAIRERHCCQGLSSVLLALLLMMPGDRGLWVAPFLRLPGGFVGEQRPGCPARRRGTGGGVAPDAGFVAVRQTGEVTVTVPVSSRACGVFWMVLQQVHLLFSKGSSWLPNAHWCQGV